MNQFESGAVIDMNIGHNSATPPQLERMPCDSSPPR